MLEKLWERQPHFTQADLRAAVYREAAWDATGAALKDAENRVQRVLSSGNLITVDDNKLADRNGQALYVDKALVVQELTLQADMHRMADTSRSKVLSRDEREAIIKKIEAVKSKDIPGFTFREDQRDAILKATDGKDLFAINALAGTGKTTSLEAVLEIQRKAGKQVLLVSPWNKAVGQMATDTKTTRDKDAFTVDKLARLVAKGELKVNKNTVIIMDEAGLASHKEMRAMVEICKAHGCALGLQGDKDQTAAVSHGDPFRNYVETRNAKMGAETDVATLDVVTRQNLPGQKMATVAAAKGDFAQALSVYSHEHEGRTRLASMRDDILAGKDLGEAFTRATGQAGQDVSKIGLAKALEKAGVIDDGPWAKQLAGKLDAAQDMLRTDKAAGQEMMGKALKELVDAHRSTVQTQFKDDKALVSKLSQDFLAAKPELKDKIAIATTNNMVDQLNKSIREGLVAKGELGADQLTYKTASDGRIALATGDRICLTSKAEAEVGPFGGKLMREAINDAAKAMGSRLKLDTRSTRVSLGDKSEFGTVTKTEEKGVWVQFDGKDAKNQDRKPEFLAFDKMPDVQHGYAATTSKLQGTTVKEAFFAVGSFINSALAYVSLSRHKEALHTYATEKDGKTMAKAMGQRDIKARATDIVSDKELGKVKAEMASGLTAEKVAQSMAKDRTEARDMLNEIAKPSKEQASKQASWEAKREAYQEARYGIKLIKDHGVGRGFSRISMRPDHLLAAAVAELRIPVVSDFAKKRAKRVKVGKVIATALRVGQAAVFGVKLTAALATVTAKGIAMATHKAGVMVRDHQAAKAIGAARKAAHERMYAKELHLDHFETKARGKELGHAAKSKGQELHAGHKAEKQQAPAKSIRKDVASLTAGGHHNKPAMSAEKASQKLATLDKQLSAAVKSGDVEQATKIQGETKALLVDQAKGGSQRVADVREAAKTGDLTKVQAHDKAAAVEAKQEIRKAPTIEQKPEVKADIKVAQSAPAKDGKKPDVMAGLFGPEEGRQERAQARLDAYAKGQDPDKAHDAVARKQQEAAKAKQVREKGQQRGHDGHGY